MGKMFARTYKKYPLGSKYAFLLKSILFSLKGLLEIIEKIKYKCVMNIYLFLLKINLFQLKNIIINLYNNIEYIKSMFFVKNEEAIW